MRPQQTDNKRLFIAVAVSMLVLLLWQVFFAPEPPAPPEPDAEQAAEEEVTPDAAPDGVATPPQGAPGAAAAPPPARIDPAEAILETDTYRLVLTNIGARAVAFEQKRPERFVGIDNLATLVGDIDPSDPPDHLPFATELEAIGLDASSRFVVLEQPGDSEGSVAFRWTSPDGGAIVTKRFRPGKTEHAVELVVTVENRGAAPIDDTLSLALYDRLGEEGSFFIPGNEVAAVCLADDDVERIIHDDDTESFTTDVRWAGVDESYFAMIARSEDGADACTIAGGEDKLVGARLSNDLELAPAASQEIVYEIYMGPKELDFLKAFGHDIDRAIDYGFFEIIARPIAWLLRGFHQLAGNWGLAIILLTLLIRGALWPVTQRSQESMMKMKDIQPELKEIQKKYENDRTQLAVKQQELFRKHGVSPLGCLPLFLQLPIWIALYRTIFVTAELYRAPFLGWVEDLSAPDPFFVLPVLAGALFFLQQKLSPTAAMTTQQKVMMTVIPLVFSAAMLFFPAGLNLYILVSSVIGMIQVLYTRKKMARRTATAGGPADEPEHAPASADERRAQQRREAREQRKADKKSD